MALPSANSQMPRLTFGVEIEFALASLLDVCADPEDEDPREVYGLTRPPGSKPLSYNPTENLSSHNDWTSFEYECNQNAKLHIANTLIKAGIPTKAMLLNAPVSEAIQSWQITVDSSIEPPDGKYEYLPIEIKSPAYYFSDSAIEEVNKVCEVLANNYRIHCGESCGFHVHVGDGLAGFSSKTLRHLMATLWTFEPQFETLHPKSRTLGNPYCTNLRDHSTLGRQCRNRRAGLEELLRTKHVKDIISLTTWYSGDRLAYNVLNLLSNSPQDVKKTIEFRQHGATLNSERLAHWIRVCVGLVEFAGTVDTVKLIEFLRENVDATLDECDVVKVLIAVGLPVQARYYMLKLADQNPAKSSTTITNTKGDRGLDNGEEES